MIAEMRPMADVGLKPRSRPGGRRARVIPFPSFDAHGGQIDEWLSAIGESEPGVQAAAEVLRSIRRTLAGIEQVRNSPRHTNLANFLRHAANAIEGREWDGARYILITALAIMDGTLREAAAPVRRLPVRFPARVI